MAKVEQVESPAILAASYRRCLSWCRRWISLYAINVSSIAERWSAALVVACRRWWAWCRERVLFYTKSFSPYFRRLLLYVIRSSLFSERFSSYVKWISSRSKWVFLRELSRSLFGKLALLLIIFLLVPVILYSEFRDADAEKRILLLDSVRAQGRLIGESLRPLLQRREPSPLPELAGAIKAFAIPDAGIKVLFRPIGEDSVDRFFFVASEPVAPAATLDGERKKLKERGVLEHLAESCEGEIPVALRHRTSSGEEELLTSITPITSGSGCWAVVTTHTSGEMLGIAIDQPYWMTLEVRLAAGIYLLMALFTIGLFVSIWRGLMRFRDMARRIGTGNATGPGFSAQNRIPELNVVAEEFDRMTRALEDSAQSIRLAAEDNAHAFKTPIAITRQALEPLKRLVTKKSPRGQRAIDVIEESIDRLDFLVAGARQLDQATAELLDPPRHEIELSRLVERMLEAYRDSFSSHGLELVSHLETGIVVRAGDDLLETVIENVIDNGIEISPEGSEVTVELKRTERWAEFAVHDRGPGVAPDGLDRIFERYVSMRPALEVEPAESNPGPANGDLGEPGEESPSSGLHMGIGLWIVRRNVEAIGGKAWAENRDGGGLSLLVRLPLAN